MTSRRSGNSWDSRQGFTMVEVMLTLCLLAAMAAFCWPSLQNSFANQRLRSAADRVRAQWLRARAEAMTSGTPYLFRYTFGGNEYWVESQPDPDAFVEESLGNGLGGSAEVSDLSTMSRSFPGTLPDGITFSASQIAPDARAATVAAEMDQVMAPDEMEPILFFPDGTTSTAQLRLQNDRGRCIELSLRGLTGVITVNDVVSGQEPLR